VNLSVSAAPEAQDRMVKKSVGHTPLTVRLFANKNIQQQPASSLPAALAMERVPL
jgi:hypothetical protein